MGDPPKAAIATLHFPDGGLSPQDTEMELRLKERNGAATAMAFGVEADVVMR